MKKGIATL